MKYKITWDAGYGSSEEIEEAENQKEADEIAYEYWLEDAQLHGLYAAEEIEEQTEENK